MFYCRAMKMNSNTRHGALEKSIKENTLGKGEQTKYRG